MKPSWPVLTALLALLVMLALPALQASAGPGEVAVPSGPDLPRQPRPDSWSAGTVAAGTAQALSPIDPVMVVVPADVGALVKGRTALFYFAPACPHCQHAMPEINALSARLPDLTWIGVATSATDEAELAAFKAEYAVPFDLMVDRSGGFARAVGARSTPALFIATPHEGANPAGGLVEIDLVEGYSPYRRGLAGFVAMRQTPDDPFSVLQGYESATTCMACHTEEATSWGISHHALAYRTLYLRERAEDLECVGCHVTGMEAGGFQLSDHSSPLADVGCESCHGPSGPHDGVRTEATATCVGCHDADHSIAFTVAKGLPHIDHFAANALSDTELRDRLQAVADGEAGRPLLAFPEGPTVGAEACQGCHEDQHRWASKKDPHSRAMDRLEGASAADPSCVACHATPVAMGGPPGQDLASFRTTEGVSCEACHGPGGDHVAAPTADNIVGLGESCPECVIEAICTSCHTPTWDPTWELGTRLEAVGH